MRGVSIGPPSRSGYALRLGARIRPTALRSSLAKPESETSLSSIVTSYVGNTKDPFRIYTSFVTSAGGQTNHSPQSEGVARTTGGTRHRPLIDPLWVGLKNQRLESDLPKDLSRGYTSFVTSAGGQTNHSPQSEGIARTTGGTRHRPLIDPLWVGLGTANTFDSIEGTINWRPVEPHG